MATGSVGPAATAVSVIVPVHGDRGELRLLLEALGRQSYAGPWEVLVVDNGDNPAIEQTVAAASCPARLVVEAAPGSYAARNAAIAVATGAVLAFTDADCAPEPQWLEAGVAALDAAAAPAFVGGGIVLEPSDPRRPPAGELWDMVYGLPQRTYVADQGWAATANLFVRRAVLDDVGGFDGTLRSGGDRDWGLRATSAGLRAVYAPDATVRHPARGLRELQRKVVRVSEGWAARERAAGRRPFPPGRMARSALPFVRSTLRDARTRLAERPRADRLRFVLVALWLQYFRLAVQLRIVIGVRVRGDRP